MPYSMTGYGGAKDGNISVEFKSVNHRYFEFSARVPRECLWAEEKLRKLAQLKISRGKVECFLRIDSQGVSTPKVRLDEELAKEYLTAMASLMTKNIFPDMGGERKLCSFSADTFLRMPGVLSLENQNFDDEELWKLVQPVAERALDGLITMRKIEGECLAEDISTHLRLLEKEMLAINELAPLSVNSYRERLEARMREVLQNMSFDPARLITETAIFAEKAAVDEETSRLACHISQMRQFLEPGEWNCCGQSCGPVGRKLDFLAQEMNREANTIGSKSQDSAISAKVLEMKSEIEKIREQVQNIE